MAVVIYGTDSSLPSWDYPQAVGGSSASSEQSLFYPYPLPGSVQATYLNKCVDTVTGQWTFWQTFFQDRDGTRYPGQGFDSTTYKVETIVYGREQQ